MIATDDNLLELPSGWTWTELGSIINIRNGYAFKSSDYQEKGVLLLRQANLGNGRVSLKKAVYLPPHYLEKYQDFIVRKGDVIIGMSGSIGKLCVYDLETPALQNQRTGLIELFEPDTRPFVRYYFSTLERLFSVKSKGVGVQNISAKDIETCSMPIPPLPEQKRIVAKIEELFTKLDAGIEGLRKVKAELKRYRQAVLKHAFEGKLTAEWREKNKDKLEPASKLLERIAKERAKNARGKMEKLPPLDKSNLPELPEGWEWASVKNVGDLVSGQHILKKDYNFDSVGMPYLTGPADFGSKYPVVSKWTTNPKTVVVSGDVLVTVKGAGVGKTNICNQREAAISRQLMAIRSTELDENYVYFFVHFSFQKFQRLGAGSTVPGIDRETILNIPLPIPPRNEQTKIVEEIERHFSLAEQIEQTVEQGLKQSDRLRQSILKRAFEGKLVPQDPSDEPAEKLLERIKAERARCQKQRNIK